MKKISEMNEDELRDYALELEQKNDAREQEMALKDVQIHDLRELNTALQKRNNDLFLKVEQQHVTPSDEQEEPEPVQTCEEMATNLFKEIIR